MKPTPEEKCKHEKGYCNNNCDIDKPSPSPEARVDWEHRASRLLQDCEKMNYHGEIIFDQDALEKDIAKALSAAFEKGREAR